jgi:peptide/nickel transport system permease protein
MRLGDIIMTIPSLLLAQAVLYVLSPGELSLIFVLAVTRIPVFLRTTRALTLELRQRTFVEAARAMGARPLRVLRREIRPLVVPTLLTIAMLDLAIVMLAAAGLSFLGVGLQPPAISWGLMVAEGREYLTQAWWVTFFPGLAIMATAFAANVLSNHYRTATDPLQAPRRRGRRS